ncbi:N-acetylmuramoyl-L-alanine amidase [Scytonema hofmannii FACHB-248]|uniref:N-acetylmuramoyl-L-alanine amidase n=1 Tax=Scytonema hofmannii FACHB-248 TaxID=1842502 RepID=A0ABR8GPH1_9CYAN|nr:MULTISPECIES: peptidoglycan recognition family protein [Nostocales]MBD2604940.1 N-acetylmuramoyl-L-alanine amidase [Scytonema hofmannii FACHB-248]
MNFKDWATRVMLISLIFVAFIVALLAGRATQLQNNTPERALAQPNPGIASWNQYPNGQIPASQKPSNAANPPKSLFKTTAAFTKYRPRYEIAWANPSNYGERYTKDVNGISVNNLPIIVLHETSNSAQSAIYFFQRPHTDENVQASYHAIIKLDGTVIYTVPPNKRAFGAANSVFDSANGSESVKTNLNLPPSVNNFAYHVSLETPLDGWTNTEPIHSGYTDAQYYSLAWLIAQSDVPDHRITTHRLIDRSGTRIDPRSFDAQKFLNLLHKFRQIN